MIKLIIVLVLSSFALETHAATYCRPTSDGKQRIQKTGTCPSGFFASGDCCEAFRRDSKQAFPKIPGKTCPTGSYASGQSCVSFR